MAIYSLKNTQIEIRVDSHGAELKSLKNLRSNMEYMWDANPAYWERTSPVLFPFVGSLNNGSFRYEDKTYPMTKHGFAKDMEFELLTQTENELKLLLRANEKTKAVYPFDFGLELGYRFDKKAENRLIVSWRVTNSGSRDMYFSIGGHPAFRCPIDGKGIQTDYKLLFDTKDKLVSSIVGENSTLTERTKEYALRDGMMNITADLFDVDTLILEQNQAHEVSLCDNSGHIYVTVSFDAPIFAIWSPARKNAPFICIEPWYGRCDRETFAGDLSEREYGNKLAPYEEFYAEYGIEVSEMPKCSCSCRTDAGEA